MTIQSNQRTTVERSQQIITDLKSSCHAITLDDGVFCVVRQASASSIADESGLPAVRLGLPPHGNQPGTDVTIHSLNHDGWLTEGAEAALVRVVGGPAQILVTIYLSAQQGPESAPRLQVMRVGGRQPGAAAGDKPTAMVAQSGAKPPVNGPVIAHCQRAGDVGAEFGDWIGKKGSKLWVEGYAITAPKGIAPDDLEYQAVLGRGWSSPWLTAGKFCGSRGMALPLLGLRIRLKGAAERDFTLRYAATFIDGSEAGPVGNNEPCEAASLAPLESFQITIEAKAKGAAKPAKPVAKVPAKPIVPPRPGPKRGR
jgi:hypothetical protein